jgi:Mlc titration factor MtfA (ptsG expression regulator)
VRHVDFGFARWRRARILKKSTLDETVWREALGRLRLLAGFSSEESSRLRERVVLFLHDKQIQGAGGLELDEVMRLHIALQACVPLLNLPLEWYDGWVEIIVYPAQFMPEVEWEDEFGVVHVGKEVRAGEAWLHGPVVLSWEDIGDYFGDGINVAIHEFAHKIDMLNGDADGFPPLHADMARESWTRTFTGAYQHFCRSVERGVDFGIDPYAADSAGEFFAVTSEVFFERPEILQSAYADVYAQLAAFYRQDPYRRHRAAGLLPVA